MELAQHFGALDKLDMVQSKHIQSSNSKVDCCFHGILAHVDASDVVCHHGDELQSMSPSCTCSLVAARAPVVRVRRKRGGLLVT